MLKYPIPKEKRIHLIRVYFHLAILPGMPTHIVATVADGLHVLTRSKKKLTIEDLRLPWKPLFDVLDNDLFLSRRQFEIRCVTPPPHVDAPGSDRACCSQISWYMGYIADSVRRFFHPAAIEEMLSTFLPLVNGTELNVCPHLSLVSSKTFSLHASPECSGVTILHANLPPTDTPSIISPYVIQSMGIGEFLYVR